MYELISHVNCSFTTNTVKHIQVDVTSHTNKSQFFSQSSWTSAQTSGALVSLNLRHRQSPARSTSFYTVTLQGWEVLRYFYGFVYHNVYQDLL